MIARCGHVAFVVSSCHQPSRQDQIDGFIAPDFFRPDFWFMVYDSGSGVSFESKCVEGGQWLRDIVLPNVKSSLSSAVEQEKVERGEWVEDCQEVLATLQPHAKCYPPTP